VIIQRRIFCDALIGDVIKGMSGLTLEKFTKYAMGIGRNAVDLILRNQN
jgi:hypothetical protein